MYERLHEKQCMNGCMENNNTKQQADVMFNST